MYKELTTDYHSGGPGGSGVNFVIERGPFLARMIGEDYDLIGFDPRGIGATMCDSLILTACMHCSA